MPATAKLAYFKVVDESKVPSAALSAPEPLAPPWEDETEPVFAPRRPSTNRMAVSRGSARLSGISWFGFPGMSESYGAGVLRPDQALAAGPRGILQDMNSSVAVYDGSGHLAAGWPKASDLFLGLPRTTYVVDPRAAYDAWDHRYWAAGLADITHNPRHAVYFLAVSQTDDPNGKWNVYGFDVAAGIGHGPDFTMFGFDRTTVSLSSRVDTRLSTGKIQLNNGIWVIPKHALESGSNSVVANGFLYVSVNGTALDTLQPVIVQPQSMSQPPGELFLSTYGFLFPCYVGRPNPCTQMLAFMVSLQGSHATLNSLAFTVPPYSVAPPASTSRCAYCLEAVGPMIPTSPVYSHGVVDFAFGIGVPGVQSHGEPGIFWGQWRPEFSAGRLSGGTLLQTGTIAMGGTQAAFFPSVMADAAGDMYVQFDSSSFTLNPSVYVAARRPSDPPGVMTSMQMIARGGGPPETSKYYSSAWTPYGDYTAASMDPFGRVWFASEYGLTTTTYGTYIAAVHM